LTYYIASDHAGFALKTRLKLDLKKYRLKDLGTYSDERVDYPGIAIKLAKRVAKEPNSLGILVCGTGIGMSIVANKVSGARAAVIYDGFTAKMARQHNNANIGCLGARNMSEEDAIQIALAFLETGFLGRKKDGKRHLNRVKQIAEIEEKHFK
jgi:ribose 5-phosphate isomerase B